jgi:hypothetical protein
VREIFVPVKIRAEGNKFWRPDSDLIMQGAQLRLREERAFAAQAKELKVMPGRKPVVQEALHIVRARLKFPLGLQGIHQQAPVSRTQPYRPM